MKMKKLIAILLVLALIAADIAAIAEGILTLPKALKVIEEEAFSGTTGVEKIVVPEGTTEIKSRAFAGSSAKEIELPSTLMSIADDAFEDSSIENVIVPDGCYAYDWTVERGYILDRVPTPAEFFGTEELDDGTLCIVDYTGEDKTIVIPNSIGGKNVTQIGDSAFESLGLISVAIPEGITRIGEAAFGWNWDLKLAPLPASLKDLGDYAFNQCNLRSIELPEGLQIIGNCAFGGNEYVESIHIPASVDYIGDGVFYDCFMLESITLAAENDAYEIVDEVLLSKDGERLLLWLPGKDDAEYVVPDGVIEIVDHAFDGVDVLERIILPESLCILGDCAFRKCVLLESIVIPDACTTIEGNVFEGCASLMEIVLPNGLEGISWASFADCMSLVRAFLPQSIRWIQGVAFDNCTALTTINLPKGISFIEDSAFDNCPNLTITVVEGSYALEWCESHEGINCTTVPDTAPEVPSHPDYTLEVLEDGTLAITGYTGSDYYLEIPQEIGNVKVTAIAAEAFANCESLGSVVIPEGIVSIEDRAFAGCENLWHVLFPKTLTELGSAVLEGTQGDNIYVYANSWMHRYCKENDIYCYVSGVDCYALENIYVPGDKIQLTFQVPEDVEVSYELKHASGDVPVCSGTLDQDAVVEYTFTSDDAFGEYSLNYTASYNFTVNGETHKDYFGYTYFLLQDEAENIFDIQNSEDYSCAITGVKEAYRDESFLCVPTFIDNMRVDEITAGAFSGCSKLTELQLPDRLITIGSRAFAGTAITDLYMPNRVSVIALDAFDGMPEDFMLMVYRNSYTHSFAEQHSIPYYFVGNSRPGTEPTPAPTPAPDTGYEYETNDNGYTITGYTGSSGFLQIPQSIENVPVTAIGREAFKGNTAIRNVVIPEGVVSIGDAAFANCKNLISINFPKSIEVLGDGVFDGTPEFNRMVYANSYMHQYFFGLDLYCVLIDIGVNENGRIFCPGESFEYGLTLPEGVLVEYEFRNMTTGEVHAQGSYENSAVFTYSFEGKDSIGRYILDYSQTYDFNVDGKPAVASGFGAIVTVLEAPVEKLFVLTEGTDGYILEGFAEEYRDAEVMIIPDSINNSEVVEIADGAFEGCTGLKMAYVTYTVNEIGSRAFAGCTNLQDVSLPYMLSELKDSTFEGCTALENIDLPYNLKTIGSSVFNGCDSLKDIYIMKNISEIADDAFDGVPEDCMLVLARDSYAHQYAEGKGIPYYFLGEARPQPAVTPTISPDVTPGPDSAKNFEYVITDGECTITGYNEKVSDDGGFYRIIVPSSIEGAPVIAIGADAFRGMASCYHIDLPEGVVSVGDGAFADCPDLQTVELPSSLMQMGEAAFENSSNLRFSVYANSAMHIAAFENGFWHYVKDVNIGRNGWQFALGESFEWNCEIPDGVSVAYELRKSADNSVVYSGITDRSFSFSHAFEGESAIGEYGMWYQVSYSFSVDGETATESSQGYAIDVLQAAPVEMFTWTEYPDNYSCTITGLKDHFRDIETLYIPNWINGYPVTAIADGAFENCTNIRSIEFTYMVNSIGSRAFARCTALEAVDLPYSLSVIPDSLFAGCSALKDLRVERNVTEIALNAFEGTNADFMLEVWSDSFAWEFAEENKIPHRSYGSVRPTPTPVPTVTPEVTPTPTPTPIPTPEPTATPEPTPAAVYPESEHPYAYYTDQSWNYTHPTEAEYLRIMFSAETRFESNFDMLYITDESGKQQIFTGTELASQTIVLPGDSFTLRLTSNGFGAYYGFSIIEITAATQAEYEEYFNRKIFTIDSSGTITGYSGQAAKLAIPDTINGITVTTIGDSLFKNNDDLISVTIPDSVTTIGSSAFRDCGGLSSVIIGNSVTSIGNSAFYKCSSLTSVTIPDSVTAIGSSAFCGCSGLSSVIIGNSITSISSYTFEDCSSLTNVTIGSSVTTIGSDTFSGCHNLAEVHVHSLTNWLNMSFGDTYSDPMYYADQLYLYQDRELLTDIVIPGGISSIRNNAFEGCSGLTSVTIGNSVTTIGIAAFYNCNKLKSVTIPDSVTTIGSSAFHGCSGLSSVIIGNSVTSIGSSAFSDCSSLSSVTIGNSVTSIGSSAFSDCSSLTGITIPDSVITIGSSVFHGCSSLTNVIIGDSVTAIDYYAFSDCSSLTSVTIGNSVTSIGSSAFSDCSSLSSVTIPGSVTTISYRAFEGCSSLSSVTIPDSVTYISSYAFSGCSSLTGVYAESLTGWLGIRFSHGYSNPLYYANNLYIDGKLLRELVIPDSVTSIGDYAFYNCRLISVTIPDSVTSIGWYAFDECSSLTSVYAESLAGWLGIRFASGVSNPLYYANNLYIGDEIIRELVIPDSVTTIGSYAFTRYSRLISVTIPDSVTTIGNTAFFDCSNMMSVTIGSGVTTIGSAAFYNCNKLKSVTIPDSVTTIGSSAFEECSSLASVTIGNSVTTIGEFAFYECYNLKSVTIPDNVTTIGSSAFALCGLKSVTIPDSVTTIGSSAFRGSSLTSVIIGNSVTTIGADAFSGCRSLSSVTIGDSVTTIGSYSFRNCNSLTSITIPDSVTSISDNAFDGCSNLTTVYGEAGSAAEAYFAGWTGVEFISTGTVDPSPDPMLDMSSAALDKSTYAPGDTVTISGIRVKNADYVYFSGNNVWIAEVTSGKSAFDVDVNNTTNYVTLPDIEMQLSESAIEGNFYISVQAYNDDGDASGLNATTLTYVVSFAAAAAKPVIDMSSAELDKSTYAPGDTVTISGIRVKNADYVHFSGNNLHLTNASSGKAAFDVEVGNSASFITLLDIEMQLSASAIEGDFYISVQGYNDEGDASDLNTAALTYMVSVNVAFVYSGITYGSEVDRKDIDLSWTFVPGADYYYVAMRDRNINEKLIDAVVKDSKYTIIADLLTSGHEYNLWIAAHDVDENLIVGKNVRFTVRGSEETAYEPTCTLDNISANVLLGEEITLSGEVSAQGGELSMVWIAVEDMKNGAYCDYAIWDAAAIATMGSAETFDLGCMPAIPTGAGTSISPCSSGFAGSQSTSLSLDTHGDSYRIVVYAQNVGMNEKKEVASWQIMLLDEESLEEIVLNITNGMLLEEAVKITWNAVEGAAYYQLSLRDLTLGSMVEDALIIDGSDGCSYQPVLTAGHQYRVHVAAIPDGVEYPDVRCSQIQAEFAYRCMPSDFTIDEITGSARVDESVTLRWSVPRAGDGREVVPDEYVIYVYYDGEIVYQKEDFEDTVLTIDGSVFSASGLYNIAVYATKYSSWNDYSEHAHSIATINYSLAEPRLIKVGGGSYRGGPEGADAIHWSRHTSFEGATLTFWAIASDETQEVYAEQNGIALNGGQPLTKNAETGRFEIEVPVYEGLNSVNFSVYSSAGVISTLTDNYYAIQSCEERKMYALDGAKYMKAPYSYAEYETLEYGEELMIRGSMGKWYYTNSRFILKEDVSETTPKDMFSPQTNDVIDLYNGEDIIVTFAPCEEAESASSYCYYVTLTDIAISAAVRNNLISLGYIDEDEYIVGDSYTIETRLLFDYHGRSAAFSFEDDIKNILGGDAMNEYNQLQVQVVAEWE